jgi:hypothetical protein
MAFEAEFWGYSCPTKIYQESPISRPRVESSFGLTDIEIQSDSTADSRRSSLESVRDGGDIGEADKVVRDWQFPRSDNYCDIDIEGSTLEAAKKALVGYKNRIDRTRCETIIVKVPQQFASDLAIYANEECIGCESSYEHLLFKATQSGRKSRIHSVLDRILSRQAAGGEVLLDTILNIGDRQKAADVAYWHTCLTNEQLDHPLSANCPHPNLWVEVFFNNSNDREYALTKICDYIIPYCGSSCAVIALALCPDTTAAMRTRIGFDLDPIDPTNHAQQVEGGAPSMAPYIGYWPVGSAYNAVQWYRIVKNEHLDIYVDHVVFRLEFNEIIAKL